jgi:transposase-like protein
VEAARRPNASLRSVAREFQVSLATVQRWIQRAGGQRLDRVDWSDRPPIPGSTRRTAPEIEATVLDLRRHLRQDSDLGFYGAQAIREEMARRRIRSLPSVRTINRILRRQGAFDARRRTRRPAPPPGWYLPEVAAGCAELDSFDIVEGLVIKDGPQVEVLNGVSLHGGLVASWPVAEAVTARFVTNALIAHWKEFGRPGYAQFDNDTIFQGPHQYVDVVGRVSRLCLSLGVVPVFAPVSEQGFQGMIENYNGAWQAKVWSRFHFDSVSAVAGRSRRFVAALRRVRAARIESAPGRDEIPEGWRLDLQARLCGRLIYVRRTNGAGAVDMLGRTFPVDPRWPNRLVRAEVDLDGGLIRFYRLRRREPADQPLLGQVKHRIPNRRFHE